MEEMVSGREEGETGRIGRLENREDWKYCPAASISGRMTGRCHYVRHIYRTLSL
mgnify:CR=1 FL=1